MLVAAPIVAGVLALACARGPDEIVAPTPELRTAKPVSSTTVSVTAASPANAPQDTTLDVVIDGSGFDSGSQASFEREGVTDLRVRVNSTRYLRSTQVVANVTIAADAAIDSYDVAITTSLGKKGIGTEKFAVREGNGLTALTVVDDESQNFKSDSRGDYLSGECGMTGEIYYGNYDPTTDTGGDATLNNHRGGTGSCPRRSIQVVLGGVALDVPFINVRGVAALSIGETRPGKFQIYVNGKVDCERLSWFSVADGGAGGHIVVTRTAADTWVATTTGNARCSYFTKKMVRVWTTSFTDVQASFVVREQQ
jgi:hypothetical protein